MQRDSGNDKSDGLFFSDCEDEQMDSLARFVEQSNTVELQLRSGTDADYRRDFYRSQ